jgi:hypothetical protein
MSSNELSLVVDFKAGNLTQDGPSRIVSNSSGSQYRNFTLGQEGDALLMRLRTTEDISGMAPTLIAKGAITGERQVAVFVRSGEQSTFFLDGEQAATLTVPGDFSNWAPSFPLLLANEAATDRRWDGEIYRVTFFNRALSETEAQTLSTR